MNIGCLIPLKKDPCERISKNGRYFLFETKYTLDKQKNI